jgi:hypothetical protein
MQHTTTPHCSARFRRVAIAALAATTLVGASACSDDDGDDDDIDNPVDGVDDQIDDGAGELEEEISEEVSG